MKYYSDKTKKMYDDIPALAKAEEEFDKAVEEAEKKKAEEEKKKAELKEVRAARAKEVDEALKEAREAEKKANALMREFIADYGSYHYSYTDKETIPVNSIWDNLFNLFF